MAGDSSPAKLETQQLGDTEADLATAAQALTRGELVAFPTETVYGLGALVTQQDAVQRVFTAKGRPENHPLIAHVALGADLSPWADVSSPQAQLLMKAFWPGPLTLVVPKGPQMPFSVTGGQDSVGIRCPAHPVAQRLLGVLEAPVAAPSANRYGKLSPTSGAHVLLELKGRIEWIIDAGPCQVGIESTIVGLLGDGPILLRPGTITSKQLETVLGCSVPASQPSQPQKPVRVSGAVDQHYCPDARLLVCVPGQVVALLARYEGQRCRLMGWSPEFIRTGASTERIALSAEPGEVAKNLYALFRQADQDGVQVVVFEQPPDSYHWDGIRDRLTRAASGSFIGD